MDGASPLFRAVLGARGQPDRRPYGCLKLCRAPNDYPFVFRCGRTMIIDLSKPIELLLPTIPADVLAHASMAPHP